MPGNHRGINPVLLLMAVLICLSPCLLFTQSAADPAGSNNTPSEDSVVSTPSDSSAPSDTAVTATPTATATPTPKASREAASGVWTSSGSDWIFMVNGTPYTGWLTDTDGKHYYFNKEGIMQTGWLDYKGRRYYLDLDGIMQTGTKTIDGQEYHFLDDGSLKE